MSNVRKIPVMAERLDKPSVDVLARRKVAAYARVSTDKDEQFTSYEAQIDYYTRYIQSRPDWDFVGMYADEGISGTSTKCRNGFKQMVRDALAGKINLIVTKSISRFARNTVDSLTTIRKLKEHGIECFFEKENIWTFDSKGELMITIISSLAQEESRSISENVTWGHRKRMADGRVLVPFRIFLGYKRGKNGEMVVDEEEAEVVRDIYARFISGETPYGIAKHLTEMGVPSSTGKKKWYPATVRSILTNEKYKGDALLQKKYCMDFLTKKQKVNNGELPQYYVENDHEAIIDPQTFDLVQHEMQRREGTRVGKRSGGQIVGGQGGGQYSGTDLLGARIVCGLCGCRFGPKTWHANAHFEKKIYRCNGKYESDRSMNGRTISTLLWDGEKVKMGARSTGAKNSDMKIIDSAKQCSSPHLYEEEVKLLFVSAVNKLTGVMHGRTCDNRSSETPGEQENLMPTIIDSNAEIREMEDERKRLTIKLEALAEQLDELLAANTRVAPNRDEFNARYKKLTAQKEKLRERYASLTEAIRDKEVALSMHRIVLEKLAEIAVPVKEFDEELWTMLVDTVTVYDEEDIRFALKDGTKVKVGLSELKGCSIKRKARKVGKARIIMPSAKGITSKAKGAPGMNSATTS